MGMIRLSQPAALPSDRPGFRELENPYSSASQSRATTSAFPGSSFCLLAQTREAPIKCCRSSSPGMDVSTSRSR